MLIKEHYICLPLASLYKSILPSRPGTSEFIGVFGLHSLTSNNMTNFWPAFGMSMGFYGVYLASFFFP